MTLAAMAYAADRQAIEQLLADSALATKGRWTLVWFACDDANQVFIARDTITGQQAVVIRGSVTDPREPAFWLDWFDQDLSVFRMADWPYGGAPAGSRLSHGALAGLGRLLALKDTNRKTIAAFLRANPGVGLTAVVGHSLGGALAYVLAAYLEQEFSPDQRAQGFWPVTFAAPTVGNNTFAAWLEAAFSAAAGRFWNSDDVVPHAWMALEWIAQSFPSGPRLPIALVGLVDGIRGALALLDDRYVQPGGQTLSGAIAIGDDWFKQAGVQHSGETYLSLLGAPPMPPARMPTLSGSM
jgi:triacylglycerol lipase